MNRWKLNPVLGSWDKVYGCEAKVYIHKTMVLGFSKNVCYNTARFIGSPFHMFQPEISCTFFSAVPQGINQISMHTFIAWYIFLGLFPANLNEIHTCQNTCKPAKVIVLATQGSWPNTCYRHHLVPLSTSDCKIQCPSEPISSKKFCLLGELAVAFGQEMWTFNLAFEHTFYEAMLSIRVRVHDSLLWDVIPLIPVQSSSEKHGLSSCI